VVDVADVGYDIAWRNRVLTPVGEALAHAALTSAR